MISALRDFLKLESAGGILLVIAAVLAMAIANSPLSSYYDLLIDVPVEVRVGQFEIAKPSLLWINDGLMAIFFLLVGLELKREVLEGELSERSKIALPALGAVGGIAIPAAVYVAINWGDPVALRGWAIPAATDIAFALGVLSLLGSRVPLALKVFLVSLAIFDDIAAIVIIALFYTSKLSVPALVFSAICICGLWVMSRRKVNEILPYAAVGLVMWVAVLKSGVHATLAGVVLALFIPMRDPERPERSPLKDLEHDLHTLVAFGILPIFAFANSGINFRGLDMDALLHPVPLGIALGLLVGKPIGVFFFSALGIRLGWTRLPPGVSLRSLMGVAFLTGIGFTMSLFIGALAFKEDGTSGALFDERLGIVGGSLLSGIIGFFLLNRSLPKTPAQNP